MLLLLPTKSVLAILIIVMVTTGCISSGSPAPQGLPVDKLEQITGYFNYNGSAWIRIDPVGNHAIGDTFVVTAKTNLSPGEEVIVQTWPVSFSRADKFGIHNGTSRNVTVTRGTGEENTISVGIDASDFRQATYIISLQKSPEIASAATWYMITAKTGNQ
ncbi:MAG: hypothetical protein Q7T80_18535 [Methanoregula sp.]|nr:hypothetical protein [Methanoregula sp.]